MSMYFYNDKQNKKRESLKRRIKWLIIAVIILFLGMAVVGILTDNGPRYQERETLLTENHNLKEQIAQLEMEIETLKANAEATPQPTESIVTEQ